MKGQRAAAGGDRGVARQLAAIIIGAAVVMGVAACAQQEDPSPVAVPTPTSSAPVRAPAPIVRAQGQDGKTYSCSYSVSDSLDPKEKEIHSRRRGLQEMKSRLRRTEQQLEGIKAKYPGRSAPAAVADRYNALISSHNALVVRANASRDQFNPLVDSYNRTLEEECSEGGSGGVLVGGGRRGRRR